MLEGNLNKKGRTREKLKSDSCGMRHLNSAMRINLFIRTDLEISYACRKCF